MSKKKKPKLRGMGGEFRSTKLPNSKGKRYTTSNSHAASRRRMGDR